MATAESAFAILALVAVLVVCLAGLTALAAQIRCIDAAREAARLAARGDERAALHAARADVPTGAQVGLRRDGDVVVATVSTKSALLPGISISADAVAATETAGR